MITGYVFLISVCGKRRIGIKERARRKGGEL